jgi:hypothetical protein
MLHPAYPLKYSQYHEYAMAHEISGEVLRDVVPWIAQVLPPLDNKS